MELGSHAISPGEECKDVILEMFRMRHCQFEFRCKVPMRFYGEQSLGLPQTLIYLFLSRRDKPGKGGWTSNLKPFVVIL